MERLDVAVAPQRANVEAAVHFARYAIAKGFVQGKRVLDIACGEGYGSYLLKQAGAVDVLGVDISAESVERARKSFACAGLTYIASDAGDLDSLLEESSFDLVISVETIEHVKDPEGFLRNLRRLTKPGGVIILSCPNDHWYYPNPEQSNPFHRRKYHFDEFRDLCLPILGNRVHWSIGTAVFGFASTPLSPENTYAKVQNTWMSFHELQGAYLVHGANDLHVDAAKSSYFVGIWNAPESVAGGAVFPISMDAYEPMVQAQYGYKSFESLKANLELAAANAAAETASAREESENHRAEAARLRATNEEVQIALKEVAIEAGVAQDGSNALSLIQELENTLKAIKREQRRIGLMLHASEAENEALKQGLHAQREAAKLSKDEYASVRAAFEALQREAVAALKETQARTDLELSLLREECARYRIGYERYIRLRRVLPPKLRSWLVRIVKTVRGAELH